MLLEAIRQTRLQQAASNKVNSKKIALLAAPSDLRRPASGLLYFLLRKARGDKEFDALQNGMLNFLTHVLGWLCLPCRGMRWAGLHLTHELCPRPGGDSASPRSRARLIPSPGPVSGFPACLLSLANSSPCPKIRAFLLLASFFSPCASEQELGTRMRVVGGNVWLANHAF